MRWIKTRVVTLRLSKHNHLSCIHVCFETSTCFRELLDGYKKYREKERQKFETLLPTILNRTPSNLAQQDIDTDENAPKPRTRAPGLLSMQGYSNCCTNQTTLKIMILTDNITFRAIGEGSNAVTQLPGISLTVNDDRTSTDAVRKTYTLLPQINIPTQGELPRTLEQDDLDLQNTDPVPGREPTHVDATIGLENLDEQQDQVVMSDIRKKRYDVTTAIPRRRASMATTASTKVMQNSTRKRLSLDL